MFFKIITFNKSCYFTILFCSKFLHAFKLSSSPPPLSLQHDPPQSFKENDMPPPPPPDDSSTNCTAVSSNIHLRTVNIAPGLFLSGLGGSVPGYQAGKQCWDGKGVSIYVH